MSGDASGGREQGAMGGSERSEPDSVRGRVVGLEIAPSHEPPRRPGYDLEMAAKNDDDAFVFGRKFMSESSEEKLLSLVEHPLTCPTFECSKAK